MNKKKTVGQEQQIEGISDSEQIQAITPDESDISHIAETKIEKWINRKGIWISVSLIIVIGISHAIITGGIEYITKAVI